MSQHSDPDLLAMLALGESVPAEVTEHVATCEQCAAELASFARVATTVRAARVEEPLEAPPASVWAGIESELGLATASTPASTSPASTSAASTSPTSTSPGPASTEGVVVELASRRAPRPWPWILAAAAAGVVIGGVGGSWVASRGPADPEPAVVAQASLDALPDWAGASGSAAVHEGPDGSRTLVLDVAGQVPEDGFREVWLIDRDVTRLVSIGVLEGSQGTFVIPSGIDLSDFAVVDVSQEGFDGDPAHSGDSIVRGILDT